MELWDWLFERRLHLGFGNPNITGALAAMLLVSLGGLMLIGRSGWLRGIIFLVLLAILSVILAATASRGGLLACLSGFGVLAAALAWMGDRRWSWMLASGAAVFVAFAMAPSADRLGGVSEDRSISTRLTVYSRIPAMTLAAPGGWGAGRSAEAYHHWFQPIGDTTKLQHVLTSHGIWLVERDWLSRLAYLGFWATMLLWSLPWRGDPPWWLGCLACWIVLAIAGIFSHVCGTWAVWILPVFWALAITASRIRRQSWPSPTTFVGASVVAAILVGGWVWTGCATSTEPSIRLRDGVVEVGSDGDRILAVVPSEPVLGRTFGQSVRANLPQGATVQVLWANGARLEADDLLIAGRQSAEILGGVSARNKAIWLNPSKRPDGFPKARIRKIWVGAIHEGRIRNFEALRKYGDESEVTVLQGVADFVPDAWHRFLQATANVTLSP